MICDDNGLKRIKEVLSFKALDGGFLKAFKNFLLDMDLQWGKARTAYATRRKGRKLIVLGREFFSKEIRDASEGAEVVLHEIMHHLFGHLLMMPSLRAKGYSDSVQGLAMDAIINAYLHRVNCASFMQRYYEPKGAYAFLRPGCSDTLLQQHHDERYTFYHRLYQLAVTLEESLEFFKTNFPRADLDNDLIGDHSSEPAEGDEEGEQETTGGADSILSRDEADAILRNLDLGACSLISRNNFADIIKQVRSTVGKSGVVRTGFRMSRLLPAKLSRRDMLSSERGREWFTRPDYTRKLVAIFFDVSGSMDEYVPLVVDLIRSLRSEEMTVHTYCWATSISEVSIADLVNRQLPDVGTGTTGEVVARYIKENQVPEAIIITDNKAGNIATRIAVPVHLALMESSANSGSFLDRDQVPNCRSYQLKLR